MPALAVLHALTSQLREAGLIVPGASREGSPSRAKALPLTRARPDDALEPSAPRSVDAALPDVDAALPDGGLPRGAVIELAAPRALGRTTSLALRACASAQAEARLRSGDPRTVGAWCAFVDPWGTLHAPALRARGVDASRLLVVRPGVEALARVVVRIAESRAFALVVVDTAGVPGVGVSSAEGVPASHEASVRLDRWGTVVRRLALAVERTDTSVLLVTDATAPRSMPLPVAMRLELSRRVDPTGELSADQIELRVAKERHGRVASPVRVAV